jgi:peptidoglycan/xylan/chitin deacetylase (PgdA/CDA1 family)
MKINARLLFTFILANLLLYLGFVKLRRNKLLHQECILSICFHKPSKEEFERCVKWFKKYNFQFLSLSDVERIIDGGLPFPKGGVLLTFDDGWQSNEANVIAVANEYQVPVTIFVSTGPVEEGNYWWTYVARAKQEGLCKVPVESLKKQHNEERLAKIKELQRVVSIERSALTIDQVRRAAKSPYVTIGGHTHSHPILINCSDEHVYDELKVSKEKLEEWTGKEVRYFAYPNGDYGLREIKILESLHYRLAFSIKREYLLPGSLKDRFELPRFMFLEGASFAENICRMIGIWKPITHQLNRFIYSPR